MDFSDLHNGLQNTSLFDLCRLRHEINALLDHPEKLEQVKRQLQPGRKISYYNEKENKIFDAVIVKVQRTWISAHNTEDGKLWNIPMYAINLGEKEAFVSPPPKMDRLDKHFLKVGQTIGFYDRENRDLYGKIIKLNKKTVSIITREGAQWRVAYSLLFKVVDGEGRRESDIGLIEGEFTVE